MSEQDYLGDATYSPEDNKLRLYPLARLDPEVYSEFREAGFRWAGKQKLFVAPMWTPARHDLLLKWCGDIGEEETSLEERAAEREERFQGYSEKRQAESDAAHKQARDEAQHMPLGQPILIGHHSEGRIRAHYKRQERLAEKSYQNWKKAGYWKSRAEGLVRSAQYKSQPNVRLRRIKRLEAEQRKQEREKAKAEKFLSAWNTEGLTHEQGVMLANHWHQYRLWSDLDGSRITLEEARSIMRERLARTIENSGRWIEHLSGRLEYERELLGNYTPVKRERPKAPPILNYQAESIEVRNKYRNEESRVQAQVSMTKAEYKKISNDYKGTNVALDGSHRVRTAMQRLNGDQGLSLCCVFLSDSKVHPKP